MKVTKSFFQILALTAVLTMPVHAQAFLTNGLVAYYPFDGNANDASGNGNNGVVQGATLTTNRFGMSSNAYAFDGVQSRIQIPETLFSGTNSAVTISAWVTTDNGPYSGNEEIFEKSSVNGEMDMSINANQFIFGPVLSNPYGGIFIGTPLNSNCVTHLAGVYQQGQGVWLYTNGILANSVTGIPNSTLWVDTSGFPLASAIGIYDYTPAPYDAFHGVIDDVRVYTRALSASEVQQLYQYESVPQASLPPIISSLTPAIGLPGTNVTISGLNFSPVASNNIVYFGAVRAAVTAASATNLTVTAPVGATFAPVTVTVNGLTAYSDQPFLPTFPGTGQIASPSLTLAATLPTGSGPGRVVIVDMDGDGRPDLVVADAYSGEISIFQNISSNNVLAFASRLVVPMIKGVYGNPATVVVADLDGDGRPDIIALNADSHLVSILRNVSLPGTLTTNSFAPRMDIPVAADLYSLAVQDLNGDGKPEIVTANGSSNNISIFQNQSTMGSISFASPVNYAAGHLASDVAIADLDGDGQPDLAVVNMNDGTVSVLRNLGNGGAFTTSSFASPVVFPAASQCRQLAIGDMDGDGKLDIVTANWSSDRISVLQNLTAGPGISTNSFAASVNFATGGWANNVKLGDLGGVGKLDVVVPSQLPSLFSIFPNASTPGSFTTSSLGARADYASGYNPDGPAIGDLNGDGKPDLVIANVYDSNIYIFLNNVPSPVSPTITNQPQDAYVYAHGTASFSVQATGASGYQWLFNGSNILNAASSTLVLSNVVQSELGQYSVIVTNNYGAITSSVANLYMYPAIIASFTGVVTDWGQNTTLSITAWGSGTLTYQWYDNGVVIPGGTNSMLTFTAIQFTNAGSYSVVVSSSLGSVTNAPAQVVVNPAGVSLGLYPGVTISGTAGYTYNIQSSPDLTNTNDWTTVATLTLQQPVQLWVDTNNNAAWPANQHRFYRVLPGP